VATDRCGASDSALVSITVTCDVPVRLLNFTATRDPEGIRLNWTIADAEDNAGFHVDRQEPGSARTRISNNLLSGQNDYVYLDRQAPKGGASYFLEEWSRTGSVVWHGPVHVESEAISETPRVKRIEPNPCIERATITYEIPSPGSVRLEIFDVRGRRVRTLMDGVTGNGSAQAIWDCRCDNGLRAAPGIYMIRFTSSGMMSAYKLILISGSN